MKKSEFLTLVLIIVVGLFLRAYKINSNYNFTGELGKELLYMRSFSQNGTLPLIGMPTSHEWLSYGPFYYWLMIPFFKLAGGNPYILFWVALFVAAAGLILNYVVIRKIIGERVALISTLVQALSPLFIWQTRLSKLHVFFWILMPILMFESYLIWKGEKKFVFWIGLTFGLLFSFHFSQIPILLVILGIFFIKKHLYKFKDVFIFVIGIFLPNLTLIWKDRLIAAWLPYRVVSLSDKNPLGTFQSFNQFLGINIFWDQRFWILGSLIFLALFVLYVVENKNKLISQFAPYYLISSLAVMFIANILHGAPPVHYFLPIFTLMPILFALFLARFRFWYLVIFVVAIGNFISFENDPLFYKDFSKFVTNIDMVPYSTQNSIVSFIVADTAGKPFSLKRVGPYDYFPDQYSQNYQYLALWKGGKFNALSGNTYTIVEDVQKDQVYVQK